jgi:hypothetical protein
VRKQVKNPTPPSNTFTMAPLSSLLTITLATTATAFSVNSGVASTSARPMTKLYENFGFDFAEDQAENTPSIILGENNYKKWLNSVDPNNMLNRQVSWVGLDVLLVVFRFGFVV